MIIFDEAGNVQEAIRNRNAAKGRRHFIFQNCSPAPEFASF
jgi:hypothetical protein